MPWFKPPDPLKFSCLGCLWTNPCYHTSQSTTVTNYTKGRSLQTGDNYWMHSFPPFTGHQNQRSQSSQMLAIWDCWFRISKYSVTRSLFLQQVNESWTNSTGHLRSPQYCTAIERFAQNMPPSAPALTEWHLSTNPPQKKSALSECPKPTTSTAQSPLSLRIPGAWYIDRPWHRPLRGPADHAKSSWNFASREGLELEPLGPWGCTRWTGRSGSGKKRVTTRPLGVASSNALSLGDEAVEVWSQAGDINGKASKISKWILWEFRNRSNWTGQSGFGTQTHDWS